VSRREPAEPEASRPTTSRPTGPAAGPVELRSAAEGWLARDPDPQTRAELRAILDAGDEAALADRFGSRLEFGTAGLRGELGAGPNRMNRLTVMYAAAGLAACLRANVTATPAGDSAPPEPSGPATPYEASEPGGPSAAIEPGGQTEQTGPYGLPEAAAHGGSGWPAGLAVVIGYDARHNSDVFARDTAAVLTAAGLTALLLPRPLPTPVLAHAVRHLGAAAGVMVTASHNPPRDNGYKVYWGDGAQIVPPIDAEISAAIEATAARPEPPARATDGWTVLGEDAVEAYVRSFARLPLGAARDVSVAYTPLHGVGREVLAGAFGWAGFPAPTVVPAQGEPDPDFPTVPFPNPEEPGAMDLALAAGEAAGADLVIANDPDADRCAVAVAGRPLTGDEVGGLLAEHVLRHTSGADRLVVTTIVSSSLLGKIAEAHGVRYAQSLTGFKWIVRAGSPGDRLVYGYEEALGYCVGGDEGLIVRDKDGIGAALAIASLAAEAKRAGRTLLDLLEEQARRYGLHATAPLTVRVTDRAEIDAAIARLRADPPERLGGRPVTVMDDLSTGAAGLPPTEGLRFRLAGDARVVVRPSGTEPKLKCYLEVVVPVRPAGRSDAATDDAAAAEGDADDVAAARREAGAALDDLRTDLEATLRLG
jgi:phosphomannomutase